MQQIDAIMATANVGPTIVKSGKLTRESLTRERYLAELHAAYEAEIWGNKRRDLRFKHDI